jgi:thiamine biosynthesis lipoprotein
MLWHEALSHNTVPDADLIKKALPDRKLKNFSIMGDTITLHNNVSIDPGAVAKGYALDCIFPVCAENSPSYAIVSFGSSTLLYSPDSTHTFNVAVKSDSDTIAGTAVTGPCFVSTSGSYERFTQIGSEKYHHILDMETGYPSESGLVSVTVFCDSGIKSDFLSTLIFIEGKEKLKAHLDSDDYSIIAIDDEGNIHKSSDLVFCEDK